MSLKIAILDANQKTDREVRWRPGSVVAHWLAWECDNAGIRTVSIEKADLVLVAYAGAIGFVKNVRAGLRHFGICPDAARRAGRPYVVAGGSVDVSPFTALKVADALCIGEGYHFVRALLARVGGDHAINLLKKWIVDYPHAIERDQLSVFSRDVDRPWLLSDVPDPIASPDSFIDWTVPPVQCVDRVARVLASKGCRRKCKFCATSWRQKFQVTPLENRVIRSVVGLNRKGIRTLLITNDVADLPFWDRLPRNFSLDSQSLSYRAAIDPKNFLSVIRAGTRVMRFGVEGVSERIRRAFGKPIPGDGLLELLKKLWARKIQTHLFFVVGAPYEDNGDWSEMRSWYNELAHAVDWGLLRIKYTTFQPYPPAPLARFLPDVPSQDRVADFKYWVANNAASNHIFSIWGKGRKGFLLDVAEALGVPGPVIENVQRIDGVVDLAPELEDARRFPWEIIKWPYTVDQRWKAGNHYKKRCLFPKGTERMER